MSLPRDPEGYIRITWLRDQTDTRLRHTAALENVTLARKLKHKWAEDYYSGFADALAPLVAGLLCPRANRRARTAAGRPTALASTTPTTSGLTAATTAWRHDDLRPDQEPLHRAQH